MATIQFQKDINKDVRNWWEANNHLSYGFDFSEKCPPEIKKKIKGKKFSKVKDYIEKHIKKYYKNYPQWKKENEKNLKPYEKETIQKLERIHKKKFPVEFIDIYYTSFPRNPYGGGKKRFWTQIYMHEKDKQKLLVTIIHELMHLFFHKYYWKTCKKKGLNDEETHDIKEAFSVLINEEFKNLKLKDKGYDSHQKIRKHILREWKKKKDFPKVLDLTIKYYKQKCQN